MKTVTTREATPGEWNDGYILEGLDRCYTIQIMLDELLVDHPSVTKVSGKYLVENVQSIIGDLYQRIGALDETYGT